MQHRNDSSQLILTAIDRFWHAGSTMTPAQRKRRDALVARSDAALDRWPERSGQEFIREMTAVAEGLESLGNEMDAAQEDPLERSRTWRFVGNAYFDLADAKDLHLLKLAVDAFGKAETLLAGIGDAIENMKLDYSYGHALFHLSDARDLALVKEARRRYARALETARTKMPAGVQSAQTALANADRVIALLSQAEDLSKQMVDLQARQDALDREENPVPDDSPSHDDSPSRMEEQFEGLRSEIEADESHGELNPVRARGLSGILSDFQALTARMDSASSIEEKDRNRSKLSRLMSEMKPHIQRPTYPGASERPSEESRNARILSHLEDLKVQVGQGALLTGGSFEESGLSRDLYMRLARLGTAVHNTQGDDAALVELETTQARSLANEVRCYVRRRHPMFADPVWGRGSEALDPNLVFVSGPQSARESVAALADAVGLRLQAARRPGADVARTRWQDLSAATLAIFDISTGDPQVFYELGIALTTGTQILIVTREGTDIPFDIAQDVLVYSGESDLAEVLAPAMDAALYTAASDASARSCVASTIAYAQQRAEGTDNQLLRGALVALRRAERDPLAFQTAAQGFAAYLSTRTEVLYTRWPGSYPATSRCFVVMPFRQDLEETYRAISQECERAGVDPIRGDVAAGQEIILSIWEEICQATHVIVDLTGRNPNVCLELGMADTLGRKTLLVGREGTEKELFPSIAKRRLNTYPEETGRSATFRRVLQGFLG